MLEDDKKLWVNVLGQAIKDAQESEMEPGVYSKRIAESARQWFLSGNEGAGSFQWICMVLDLEPEFVRRLVLNKYEPRRTQRLT
ncbi:MAG: hypothetical protein HQ561_13490 [Desulfobacteraceae bacterium]|nr:hypothetical protein [Desulfobacteraceae bacterium]